VECATCRRRLALDEAVPTSAKNQKHAEYPRGLCRLKNTEEIDNSVERHVKLLINLEPLFVRVQLQRHILCIGLHVFFKLIYLLYCIENENKITVDIKYQDYVYNHRKQMERNYPITASLFSEADIFTPDD
jgi:hypothetical protein